MGGLAICRFLGKTEEGEEEFCNYMLIYGEVLFPVEKGK